MKTQIKIIGTSSGVGVSLHNPFETHKLAIAKRTITMPDAMLGVMRGMSKAEAAQVIRRSEWRSTLGRVYRNPLARTKARGKLAE